MKPSTINAKRKALALSLALLGLGSPALHAWTLPQERLRNAQPPGSEGPLDNDCFLPTDPDAEQRLERGDQALLRARSALQEDSKDAQRFYIECFDVWHEALLQAAPEASVWVNLKGAPERSISEGLRYAVQRRIQNLTPTEKAQWSARLEPLAEPALVAAGLIPAQLKSVVQRYPSTRSASLASLRMADITRERGTMSAAGSWLLRAKADLPEAESAKALAQAIELRTRGLLREERGASALDATSSLELVSSISIGLDERQRATGPSTREGSRRHARPGLAVLSKTRIAVQTPGQVRLIRIAANGALEAETSFDSTDLRFRDGTQLPFSPPRCDARRMRKAPGWQFAPAASGSDLFLVAGQSVPEGLPNGLLSISLPPQLLPGSLQLPGQGPQPRLNWAILGNEFVNRDGESRPIDRLWDLVDMEFQPGVMVQENRILVQVRSYGDVVRSWLMSFGRHTGRLQWRYLLGTGSDLLADQGRLGGGTEPRLSAPPMTLVDGPGGWGKRLFVASNLGFGVLLDLEDGRPLWSIKNRRRDVSDLGWDSYEALMDIGPEADAIWWAPFDSDRLYALRAAPLAGSDLDRFSAFTERPVPIGESRTLMGADGQGVVVQGRSGFEPTVSSLFMDPKRGSRRQDALYLGPGEEFLGRGLLSSKRVLACSERGLYLFDRTRELYLLGFTPLPQPPRPRKRAPGGDLYALDGLILALGKNGIWSFRPN